MGYNGPQLKDSDGVDVGTSDQPVQEYSYLNGRAKHYKLVGASHGGSINKAFVQEVIRKAILG